MIATYVVIYSQLVYFIQRNKPQCNHPFSSCIEQYSFLNIFLYFVKQILGFFYFLCRLPRSKCNLIFESPALVELPQNFDIPISRSVRPMNLLHIKII